MISIIVCSKDQELFKALSENVKQTIGVEFELIPIENPFGEISICSAYNKGASEAKFPYLCFVHEDVLFKTNDWGVHVLNHFLEDKEIGLIGIAGTVYKSKMAAGWGQSEAGWAEPKRMNIIQHYKGNNRAPKHIYFNPLTEIRASCVAIDGVLMITKKDIWRQHKFDESLLKGFHGYDLDYSLQIIQHHKVYVVYDIMIDHFSGGNFNAQWLEEVIKVHKKWKKLLPVAVLEVEPERKAIYLNGWKRLRKNIMLLVNEDASLSKTISTYNKLFLLLDSKPSIFILYRSYFAELFKIIMIYLKRNKNVPSDSLKNLLKVV